ncbi:MULTISPECIES: DUF6572 domain-containing protein [unclassified Caballeronia]|uniref:DUF6572 domain-containing protein n=1 Tax=unclassified Caballeronia TaxID=2646786 RepID=UPI001F2E5DB0|nr:MULTISPECIES: DUF6572 domain-containing protein [unclassified Caballeronia]MCE4544792.1 hypothetical protein [Caballeronia sp. PC1]MCE4570216.1 hypothetical protein [Caballeronia sp. CLC5]
MSVRDVDAIDYIGVNILFRRVYVGLFDELDWRDEREHQDLLTKKIDRYISYVRSGKLLLNYPKVRGYEIVIEYVSMHAMPASAREYWKSRERLLADAGYTVHIRGVDVRHSLGLTVDEPEHVDAEPVEPPALEVLDPDPHSQFTDIADISYLPPLSPKARRQQALPVLRRLAMRQATGR